MKISINKLSFVIAWFFSFFLQAKEIPSSQLAHLKDINGLSFDVASAKDYQILYFWATWCPSCKEKMKGPLAEIAKANNLDIRLINTEKDFALVKNYVDREKITLPVYVDADKSMRNTFAVNPVPHWVLLRKQSNSFSIIDSEVGWDWDKIKSHITKSE